MTKLELPDGMGPAEALRGLADDLLAPDAKLRAFVDFGREDRWDSGPLEGATHGGFLRLVADLIERETAHDPSKDVSMSAYDLLPEEDRKAIAWVRENGGVEECDRKVAASMEVADSYTLLRMELGKLLGYGLMEQLGASDNELVEKIGKLAEFFEGMHDGLYTIDATEKHDGNEMIREVFRHIMPKGMEWPMFEDGEQVRPGDRLQDKDGDWFKAVSFVFTCDWWSIEGYQTEGFGDLNDETSRSLDGMPYGKSAKRPAPKVLDADGVEIRIGDEVWCRVCGGPLPVTRIDPDGCVYAGGNHAHTGDDLTHERHDSWPALFSDAAKGPCDYFGRASEGCDGDGYCPAQERLSCIETQLEDLVRRAKKLE